MTDRYDELALDRKTASQSRGIHLKDLASLWGNEISKGWPVVPASLTDPGIHPTDPSAAS